MSIQQMAITKKMTAWFTAETESDLQVCCRLAAMQYKIRMLIPQKAQLILTNGRFEATRHFQSSSK